jgi:transcriptional regulator with AAA-type ATPase domain
METTNKTNHSQRPIHSPTGHMDDFLKKLELIAYKESSSVLFIGEPGTGKELLFKYTRELSPRRDKPFEIINGANLPENLVESELFGHVKGVFTGAERDRKGLIEVLNGGTLFLDELGALKPNLQQKLLRVIEYKEFRKVGGDTTEKANVRFIAATNEDYESGKEKDGNKQEIIPKLKDRFNHHIIVKPLRERKEDIPYIVRHLLKESGFKSIEIEALWCLMRFKWEGNVRELINVLHYAKTEGEGKNPDDPSKNILCGFHLPDEITDKFHLKFDKLRYHTNFQEAIREKHPVEVFRSNVAADYWLHSGAPEWVKDNTCLHLPLDDNFPVNESNMRIDCSLMLSDSVQEEIDRLIEEAEDGAIIDVRLPRIARNLHFRKNPVLLFDLPYKEAEEKFKMIYMIHYLKKHPNASQTKKSKHYGVIPKTVTDWEKNLPPELLKSIKNKATGDKSSI